MNDQAHIGLINTHSEGICCDHHADFSTHPASLAHLALGIGQPSVVVGRTDPHLEECVRHRLTELPISTVDDGGSLDFGENEVHHLGLVVASPYRIGNIGAKEALLIEGIAWAEL